MKVIRPPRGHVVGATCIYAPHARREVRAGRKPLERITPQTLALNTEGLSEGDLRAIEKDRHLLEAAVAADRIIVTRDEALRVALERSSGNARLLASITWVNPVDGEIRALESL
jgi:hypothetical protein